LLYFLFKFGLQNYYFFSNPQLLIYFFVGELSEFFVGDYKVGEFYELNELFILTNINLIIRKIRRQ